MSRSVRGPALLALLVLGAAASQLAFHYAGQGSQEVFYLGGIQVNEPDHEAWVETLAEERLNTVAVTVYAHQGDWDSANLWYEEEEPYVVSEMRAARRRGLEVVLVLRVALDHAFERNRFLWHGMIMPATDQEVDEWFRRYTDFVLRWSAIAQREGVDVLAVASEMNTLTNTVEVEAVPSLEEYFADEEKVADHNARLLERARGREDLSAASLESHLDDRSEVHRRWARRVARLDEARPVESINHRRRLLAAHWRRLIDSVRREYTGQVTYAANFDQYEMVAFWDVLDVIGVNAYFPLRRRLFPQAGEWQLAGHLQAGWTRELSRLDAFRRASDVPDHRVLFTEIGYVRRANATLEPWASSGVSLHRSLAGEEIVNWEQQPLDRGERALAFAALWDAYLELDRDLLAGLLYWKLSTDPGHEEIEPFALIVGDPGIDDPLLVALQRFSYLEREQRRRRLSQRAGQVLDASLLAIPGVASAVRTAVDLAR